MTAENTPAGARPRRRWCQFGLRTLFGVTTVAILLVTVWRVLFEPYRIQRQVMRRWQESGGVYTTRDGPAWIVWLLGSADVQVVETADLRGMADSSATWNDILRCPDLRTLAV